MANTKYTPSKKTFSQIQAQWDTILTMDPKSKIKAMRQIGHDLLNSYDKSEMSIEQLVFYMKILKPVIHAYTDTQKLSKLLLKVTGDWLVLSGNANSKIISIYKSELFSDCPHLCIGDLDYFVKYQNNSPSFLLNHTHELDLINEGKIYQLGTGGDAEFYLEFRVIDSAEPILSLKEMKYVQDCTETVIMDIPTGIITVAHYIHADVNSHLVTTTITPGNYKMTIFFILKKRVATFCIVLCKTNEAVKNNYRSIYSFSDI